MRASVEFLAAIFLAALTGCQPVGDAAQENIRGHQIICDKYNGERYCFAREQVFAVNPPSQKFGFGLSVPISDKHLQECNKDLSRLEEVLYPFPHVQFSITEDSQNRSDEVISESVIESLIGYVPPKWQSNVKAGRRCYSDRRNWATSPRDACVETDGQNQYISACETRNMEVPSCSEISVRSGLIAKTTYQASCYAKREILRQEINRYLEKSRGR